MKKFLICLFALPLAAVSQTVTVSGSEEFTNIIPAAGWNDFLGTDDAGNYYIVRKEGPISNEKVWLEKYLPSFKSVYTKNIAGGSGTFNENLMHRFTLMNKGKVLIFLEGWSKSAGENSLLVKEVGEDGSLPENGVVLEKEPSTGQMKSANYTVSFSPDGSKMLVLTEKPFKKGEMEGLRLQVFNTSDYSSAWKKDLTLENESERYPDNDVAVDNNGVAYLFKDVKISGKEHHYFLYTNGTGVEKKAPVDLKTYFPTKYKMAIAPDGNLAIAGNLNTLGQNGGDWRAIWYMKANAEGTIVQNYVEQLGPDLVRLVGSEKNAATDNFSLDNYTFRDFLFKPDGGIILLAEQESSSSSVVGTTQPPVYEYTMEYGNVIAVSFDGSGNRLWNNALIKHQQERTHDRDKHYGSFAYQLKNNNLYLVWNFTDLQSDITHPYRAWFDRNGTRINIDNIYGDQAYYPTLLTVINPNGGFAYADHTFNSLTLDQIQKPNAFRMAIDPAHFFATKDGLVILSRMPGPDTKRFKFSRISY